MMKPIVQSKGKCQRYRLADLDLVSCPRKRVVARQWKEKWTVFWHDLAQDHAVPFRDCPKGRMHGHMQGHVWRKRIWVHPYCDINPPLHLISHHPTAEWMLKG